MAGRLLESLALSSVLLVAPWDPSLAQHSPSRTPPSSHETLAARLEAELPKLMREWKLPGLSIAIIQEGEVTWRQGLGVKSIPEEAEVDDRTVFTAASLTKPVFAYAVLRLCDEGLLDLDTPLVSYAPKEYIEEKFLRHPMEMSGFKEEWFSRITARMALSHSSGLQHFGLKTPVELLFEPGTGFQYSSNGIEYLRYVVEHLTGSRIDSVVERYVFRPLNMARSSLFWRDEFASNSAAGHDRFGASTGSIEKFDQPTAQASLYTTADDYGKFLRAVLKGEGLAESTFRSMVTPQIQIQPDVYWGLGFGIEQTSEGKGIWHWGDAGTYTSYFHVNLDRGTGFVYLSNSHYGLAILDRVFALVSGGEHPALSVTLGDWSFAEDYLSPGMAIKCRLFNGDVDDALAYYRRIASASATAEEVVGESRLEHWARDLLRHGRIRDAMAVLRLRIEAYHPEESDRAAMQYVRAAATALEDTRLAWCAETVQAMREPVTVADDVLKTYVGSFDPFRITHEDGALFFGREGAGQIRMIPVGERAFVFEELDYFRVEMVEEDGEIVAVRGIFSEGHAEVYRRTE